MRPTPLAHALAIALGALLLVPLLPARPAQGGCGCDHPPPGFAAVMPAFGSPGKTVRVNAPQGKPFKPGASYLVKIGGGEAVVAASDATHLLAPVMPDAQPGPTEVEIVGSDDTWKYPKSAFTVLAAAPRVPERDGLFVYRDFRASVSEDGTFLLPFNLSDVADPMQFMVMIEGLALGFEQDDVVFFNADGVDLTLFTLAVDDPTQRQWGSYHGWEVEQDTGLFGTVYENKILESIGSSWSDQLTYWRHEFHTYKAAHAPGGTHEVGPDGNHKQLGTRHIDHDHLVLALSGKLRDPDKPRAEWDTPSSGYTQVDVYVLTLESPAPIEPETMMSQALWMFMNGDLERMRAEGADAYTNERDDD